ncbi:MAG: MBL fold metallo-hydrolase [Candidatus Thiodiazotropha sp. (ex Lucinoma borealis)]|nr:MBL fold metallo-hydrolase [Candidatus Thiodiazotropha sp. (ex Lucinoma borealis)]
MNIHLYCLFILSFAAHASFAENSVHDYPIDKIAPHTYVIHGPLGNPSVENQSFMNNPGFVVTDTGVVLIDPGSSVQVGRMVLKQIKTITDKPITHVINTHIHGDHWLGNQAAVEAFPKVELMAHPNMIMEAHAGAAERWVSQMEQLTEGFTKGTRAVIPTVSLLETTKLEAGGITFRIHAPDKAHSDTDVMIEVVQDSVLFLGDNVLYKRIPRLDDATFKGNIVACDVAIGLGVKHFVPGHGPAGGVSIVKEFRLYLETLYNEVARLYEEGLTDYEMKPIVLRALIPYSAWSNFYDQLGRHVSLATQEVEQDSF